MGEAGNLRPGCRIVHKGEILSARYFTEKNELFASHAWCHMVKVDLAWWINDTLQPDKRRIVFDPSGSYLAQVHIGKCCGSNRKKRLLHYNSGVKIFNELVRVGVLDREEARGLKAAVMCSAERTAVLRIVFAISLWTIRHPGRIWSSWSGLSPRQRS